MAKGTELRVPHGSPYENDLNGLLMPSTGTCNLKENTNYASLIVFSDLHFCIQNCEEYNPHTL